MSRTLRFAAALVGLSALGIFSQPVAASVTPHHGSHAPLRVMPLGDSITKDNGAGVVGAYRTRLWELSQRDKLPIDFVGSLSDGPEDLPDKDHEGHGSHSIDDLDKRVEVPLVEYRPDVILLHIGSNDMWKNDAPKAIEDLSRLLDHIIAVAPQARVFVAQLIPQPAHEETVKEFNAEIPGLVEEKVAQGAKLQVVDMHSVLDFDDLHDGIHPTEDGFEEMAEKWWDVLTDTYASARR